MSDKVFCGKCGEPITGEAPGLDVAQRKPCPKCGSTSRAQEAEATFTGSSSLTVDATVITYPQKLLTLARQLIDDGEFGIAVVVAHIACEVATERTLSDAFVTKGISYLEDAVTEFFSGYNLGNSRIRKLYTALTGDEIQTAPFWAKFQVSVDRRSKVVHSSATVTKAEAEESLLAAEALVAHLKK